MKFIVYTDGACSGNPGPGGWGAIVGSILGKKVEIKELGDSEIATTNNRMELGSVLAALQYIDQQINNPDFSIQIYTDSVYVIKGITQWVFGWKKRGWKNAEGAAVVNQDIWEALDSVVYKLQKKMNNKIKWDYVRGHQGTPGNERCDKIAVALSKNDYVNLYHGSGENYLFDITEAPPTEPLPENKFTKAEKPKTQWYVVLKNGVITRFKTWSECEASVKGAPGVKFKKVTSEAEEAEVLKGWGR
ncbi:viroplasmin family protein [Pseudobdellovibrio sp. HCB154]|uniref:ribonuclease H1 domain-containing protein n=1 Tax=Pseudobdellovibrio sp. HCB154 TaxID=3386277 RepID=UPI003916EE96